MRRSPRLVLRLAVVALVAAPALSGPGPSTIPALAKGESSLAAASLRSTPLAVVAAAGDVACDPGNPDFNHGKGRKDECHQLATWHLMRSMRLDAVLPLGDLQYDDGSYGKYLRSYRASWGHADPIAHPVPGNHEYWASPRARGYFDYFGSGAGTRSEGWYSFDLGSWHLVALNSNCDLVGCERGSDQYGWLKADLGASAATCTLAYFHHPRFSSGPHGGTNDVLPFWRLLYRSGADVVLSAHDHHYERFARVTATGAKDRAYGIQSFVVGTGGAEHYWIEQVQPHSVVRSIRAFGVLRLKLFDGSWTWSFVPALDARFHDSGSLDCHGAPV